ncbi:MAG: heme NO-binding domain-containing protein [Nitrospirota bacterium]
MKGTILKCMGEMVTSLFGEDKWQKILEMSGLRKEKMFLPIGDVDDHLALKIVDSACKVLNINLSQAADAFGEYWMNVYAPKIYGIFYQKNKGAKDFLLDMDNVHVKMTETLQGSQPPRFKYEWKDKNTLIIHYISKRGLIDFVVGLVKGVGKYYKEDLKVTKIGSDMVEVAFYK